MKRKWNKLYILPALCIGVACLYIIFHIVWIKGYSPRRDIGVNCAAVLILWAAVYLLVPGRYHRGAVMVIHVILFTAILIIAAFELLVVIFLNIFEYELSHGAELNHRMLPTMMASLSLFHNLIL